jgi:hypothetical protein
VVGLSDQRRMPHPSKRLHLVAKGIPEHEPDVKNSCHGPICISLQMQREPFSIGSNSPWPLSIGSCAMDGDEFYPRVKCNRRLKEANALLSERNLVIDDSKSCRDIQGWKARSGVP